MPSNQNLIYAATDTLGLFVSSNGGKSWANAKAVGAAIIHAIAVDELIYGRVNNVMTYNS